MSEKKAAADAGYKSLKKILMDPKGALLFAGASFIGYTVINKARNRTGIKVFVDFVEKTSDSVANAIPVAK